MRHPRDLVYAFWKSLRLTKVQATIALAGIYIFFSFAGNIAATKVTYFGSLVMDAGFIYCLTFTWRDLIHKQLGRQAAITTIILASIINLIAALYFQLVVALPAETSWAAAGGQSAWGFLFGIQIRIVIGSIIAQIVSELADTQTYQWWTSGFGKNKPQWLRVVVSNVISTPIDSIVFPLIAFTGIVSTTVMLQMFVTNIAVKFIVTAISWWMIYLVPDKPIYIKERAV
ncbi:MAG TPA: queuosine precursor transporter [Candidatus Nanoarchaeia archaeon]|nr:queuosine precursor transporter [Candidatus Nanoarchaeia archaeon]